MFVIATPVALFVPLLSVAAYAAVVIIWFIPDRRIEKTLAS